MGETILIIDDDEAIGNLEQEVLEGAGYRVLRAYSGTEALLVLQNTRPDLALLDLMLPGLSGEELLLRLQGVSVIVVSAKAGVEHKVALLMDGAADYLTKPFDSNELLACIRAITRRNTDAVDNALAFGDLRLELDTCQLSCGERSVRLSKKEFAMMEKLMANSGKVVTKEQLLLSVWGYESDAEDNNVEVYISFLRKKLKYLKSFVSIKTLRMVGYTLQEADQ